MEEKPERDAVYSKVQSSMYRARLGKILFNFSILGLALCLCSVLSFLTTALIILAGAIIILLTLGTIFAIDPDFGDKFLSAIEMTAQAGDMLLKAMPITASVTIAAAIIALILLATDRYARHTARIVVSCVIVFVSVLSLICVLV